MAVKLITQGVLIADGSEQIVAEMLNAGNFAGYISLANMLFGDTVIIRQYMVALTIFEMYALETYNNVQAIPMIYITPKEVFSGMRVTLEQTAGIKTFRYLFLADIDSRTVWV